MSDLKATPSSVSFGSVSVGASSSINVALAPTSTEEGVSVHGVLLIGGPPFSLTETLDQPVNQPGVPPYGDATLIDAGASRTITVNFKPTATGARTGTVRVLFNGIGMPAFIDIPLAGTGV